ncbi:unnamed protein product [Alopecurus aequalis]
MTVELQALPGTAALPPGFRFHPTDEELIVHYLRKRAAAAPCPATIIAEVDIYKLDPWDLPSRAVFGQPEGNEWYFFSPRDRKYPNGVRPSRSAGSGYWKATGTDKTITAGVGRGGEMVGVKKALVFYQGRPPKGRKTNWIMHEYRLADAAGRPPIRFNKDSSSMRLDDWVLCRIHNKRNHHQLSPLYEPPSSSIHHQHQDDPNSSHMSGPLSISDYIPPLQPEMELSSVMFFLTTAGAGVGDQANMARKRLAVDDFSNNNSTGEMTLHASKRWLSNDASMTTTMPMMDHAFSMFGPDQPSQNRI